MTVKNYEAESSFGFDFALQALKDGRKVCREGWNGKGMSLELQSPDENSKMTLPYIFMNIPKEVPAPEEVFIDRVPWIASQTDLLSSDWRLT